MQNISLNSVNADDPLMYFNVCCDFVLSYTYYGKHSTDRIQGQIHRVLSHLLNENKSSDFIPQHKWHRPHQLRNCIQCHRNPILNDMSESFSPVSHTLTTNTKKMKNKSKNKLGNRNRKRTYHCCTTCRCSMRNNYTRHWQFE